MRGIRGMEKEETNRGQSDGQSRKLALPGVQGLLQKFLILISLEAPAVQAKLIYPKDNMTSHSIATEHQPTEGTNSLQYFSGKILEAFPGSYVESNFPVPPRELKGEEMRSGPDGRFLPELATRDFWLLTSRPLLRPRHPVSQARGM